MPANTAATFSPSEWSFLATLLKQVADQFSYKSATEFALEASAANKAMVAAAIEQVGVSGDWADDDASWQDYVAAVMNEDEQIVAFQDWMAAHLATRCAATATLSATPLNAAELALCAELLDVARDDHDDAEPLGLVPHAIETSADNRAILAKISSEETRPPGQETSVPFKAALIHFAERCLHAA
jgi:hypothetical protein